jgi:mRNA-degrading endonuclease RelE of RelBE toxin-antitoxin system
MTCEADISAIQGDIDKLDGSIQKQVYAKIEKVKENPGIGEPKRGTMAEPNVSVVKVNNQRIVMFYRFSLEEPCTVTFVLIKEHDKGYMRTY